MSSPRGFNDGNLPFGSQRVTLPSGVECIAEEINFDEPSTDKDRMDEKAKPNGQLLTAQKIKGSMTLQLPTQFVDIPERFTLLVLLYRNANKQFVISRVGQPQKQDDIRKFPLEIIEVLNPGNTSTF